MTEPTTFDWVRRMGVHEAYHLSPVNRVIHWTCIPLELAALLKLLALMPGSLDLVAIAGVGVVYLATDLGAGALMVGLLVVLRALVAPLTSGTPFVDGVVAVALFVAAFVFQTRVGHGVFEHGIDDTAMNLAEFRRTRNPIPLVLVFYYHLWELLLALGYRPALQQAIADHRTAELARIPADPRR